MIEKILERLCLKLDVRRKQLRVCQTPPIEYERCIRLEAEIELLSNLIVTIKEEFATLPPQE